MSRFNTVSQTKEDTTNLAGGQAFSQSPEMELVSILLTSFANDQFYRSADGTFTRLRELIKSCNPKFVAQAAVFARTKFGMRSISHVAASELAKVISGEVWAKDFYNAVVHRPDDMTEIASYHMQKHGKLPKAMQKGFAKAISEFKPYELAKYRGEGKGVKLVDIVNLVHPKRSELNATAIEKLVKGNLKAFDTWETELSKAGQKATSDDERIQFKKDAWIKMIREKKIGHFALLRNLRNIIEQAPEVITEALALLTDEKAIRSSLVLPFRYITALEEIQQLNAGGIIRETMIALNKAVDISCSNVPKFDGSTCVVLDISGSMSMNGLGNKSPHIIGALFSAILVKANNADFMAFGDTARYKNVNPMDSVLTIANSMRFDGGGTNFHSIFQTMNKKYDRIIILSDMQGWIGSHSPILAFNQYKSATKANPFIYSFDLAGHGSMQFPDSKTFCIAGFSEKTFETMTYLEQDKNAMINEIKKIEFV